jgi:hypothetical protein
MKCEMCCILALCYQVGRFVPVLRSGICFRIGKLLPLFMTLRIPAFLLSSQVLCPALFGRGCEHRRDVGGFSGMWWDSSLLANSLSGGRGFVIVGLSNFHMYFL